MTISIYLSHLNILLYLIYLFIWFLPLEKNLMMWPLAFLDLVWFIIKLDVYGVGRQFTSKYILCATTKAAVEAVKPAAIIFFLQIPWLIEFLKLSVEMSLMWSNNSLC